MEQIVDRLKAEQHRSTTRRNYYCIWKLFNKFFLRLDRKPNSWEDQLNLFVAYLVETNKKSTMVRSYISAIKAVLIGDNREIKEDKFLISAMTRACRLKNDRVHNKIPIKRNMLKLLLYQLSQVYGDQPYLYYLYKAMFTVAYYGLLRISEIENTPSGHAVKAKDVHVGRNKNKLMLVLHTSKRHTKGNKPQIIKICSEKSESSVPPIYCPFKSVQDYLQVHKTRASVYEHFFIFRDRTPVGATAFRAALKKVIKAAGLQSNLYSSHCFRAGRMTDMMNMGVPLDVIKKIGRWKSNAVFTYMRT